MYQRGMLTQQTIFLCAKKVMYENGYKSTTIEEIAARAGVPQGLVSYYYKKKSISDKIFIDFFTHIYNEIEAQLGSRVENALQEHAIMNKIVCNVLFNDEAQMNFYLEISNSGLMPNQVHEIVRNRVVKLWFQFKPPISFEEYYLLNIAEYGARKELFKINSSLDTNDLSYQHFVNLLSTITAKLAGISAELIQYNLEQADHLYLNVNLQNISLL